jgi:hypothetical protein
MLDNWSVYGYGSYAMNINRLTIPLTLSMAIMTIAAHAGSAKGVIIPPPPSISAWSLGATALYLEADAEYEQVCGCDHEDQDYEFAYRWDIAYDNGGTFGYRLTYFDFEGSDGRGKSGQPLYKPEILSIDAELVRNVSVWSWIGSYSFGLRYMEYQDSLGSTRTIDFDGWGPTVGFDLVRPITDSLGVYTTARLSWIFGNDGAHEKNMDDLVVFEAGLGLQYQLNRNAYIRLGIEAQRYFDVHGSDTDLIGAALRLGLIF